MGGRFWLGIALLVLLLAGGLLLSGTLAQGQGQIVHLLEQAGSSALSENMAQAASLAQQAYGLWQQRWQALAAIVDHAPLDEVEATFQQLLAFGKTLDQEEFSASCGRLISGVTAIAQAHELSWWNFF